MRLGGPARFGDEDGWDGGMYEVVEVAACAF